MIVVSCESPSKNLPRERTQFIKLWEVTSCRFQATKFGMFYNAALVEQNSHFCQNFHSLFQPEFCWCQIWSIKYHWPLTLCFFFFLLSFFLNFRFVSCFVFILQNRSRCSSLTYTWLTFKNASAIQFWTFRSWAQWSLLRAWSSIIFHGSFC